MLGAASQLASFQWLFAGAAGLGGLAAGAAWGRWAARRGASRALLAVQEAMRGLERGAPARMPTVQRGEAASVAASFNAMADAVDERERVLTQLAMSDPETGLPNRRALEAELGALTASGGHGAAAVAVSIEGFATLRAAIGHEAAVTLVGDIAQRLAAKAPAAMVGRLAPDTLALVFGSGGTRAAEKAASSLAAELEGSAAVGDATADVSLAVGVAPAEPSAAERSPLVRASIAVEQARAARRKLAVFDEHRYGDPAANLSLAGEMRRAIEAGQIEVHHQPKYDLRQGRTVGVEALVRWAHPKRGLLSPGVFVRLAEATGHIRALTDHVLARAIADQAAMRRAGHQLDVSVNITGRLLCDPGFVEHVIATAGAAQGDIWLEVTEAELTGDPEQTATHIERLAAAGVGVALDNYGAGPMSLPRLREIRAGEVKIDQALILDVADARRNMLLVRGAVELAHGLGMKVTAKGVETTEAYALLSGMGCDFAQGFLIERPMPLTDLLAFLAEHRATARFG